MNIAELQAKFIALHQYEPKEVNKLLDFARQMYIRGEITISEYRNMIRELEALGACKPDHEGEYIEF